jgi:hypothetical protein
MQPDATIEQAAKTINKIPRIIELARRPKIIAYMTYKPIKMNKTNTTIAAIHKPYTLSKPMSFKNMMNTTERTINAAMKPISIIGKQSLQRGCINPR